MTNYTGQVQSYIHTNWPRWKESGLITSLIIAVFFAIVWWLIAVLLIQQIDSIPLWYDQKTDFTQVGKNLGNPYETPRFVNPPWTAIFLVPFTIFPLSVSVLIQLIIYFVLLAIIIHKYGGNTRGVLVTVSSFIAFDNALELNIEWLVLIGLLVPPFLSSIFILMKPQVALGFWLSYSVRQWLWLIFGGIILLIISLLTWGYWPDDMQAAILTYSIPDDEHFAQFNIAPSVLMPQILAWIIGLYMGIYAFMKRDPVWGIIAWLFFVPYVLFYTFLVYFALLTTKLPLLTTIITLSMWIIYGGIIILVLIQSM